MGILETIDAKVWVGDREQRIVPPGYKPRPVAASSEWLVSHSDWKRRSLAQRGTLLAEYASDEDADGPPRLRKQRDSSVDLRTSRVPQTRQAKHRDLLSEFRTYGATQGADVDALMDGADVRPVVALLCDFGPQLW